MRPFPALLAVATAFALAMPAAAEPIELQATPVALNPDDPADREVGQLVYRGGLELVSSDPRFGGLSAVGVSANGKRMVALSDRGTSLAATLIYDDDGNLAGLADPDLVPLTDPRGEALMGQFMTDAEGMAPGVGGEIIVSFEHDHRIWAYPPGETRAVPVGPPDGVARLPQRAGIEALTLLDDGRLLAIAEGAPEVDTTIAWASSRSGWEVMTYRLEDGFLPTGAATLPEGGDVLLLERYFTPRGNNRMRIRRLAAGGFEPGAELTGAILATLAPPHIVDNFEGIETRRSEDGRTLIYVISDDNFQPERQRTLLLMFELRT